MKKILLFIQVFFWIGGAHVYGQDNYRTGYFNADPVKRGSTLGLEEKVKIHQDFLEQAIQEKDSLNQLYALLYLFHDYLRGNDYAEATPYLLEAEKFANASGRVDWQGWVVHRKGILSLRLKNFEESIVFYKKAAELCGEGRDSLCLAESLEQVSALYAQISEFTEAKKYFELAMPLITKFGTEIQEATTLNNYAIALSHQNRPQEAIPYYRRAIDIYDKHERHKEGAQAMNNLADAYRLLGQYDLAIATYDSCIQYNKTFNLSGNLITNYMGLYVLYNEKGDFQNANKFLIQHYDLRDSIIGAETQDKIAELEIKYDSQNKELALQKSRTALLVAQQSLQRGVGVFIIVLMLIFFGLYRWRKQKRQAERERAENQENLQRLTRILLEKNTMLSEMEVMVSAQATQSQKIPNTEAFEENLYNQRILTDEDWSTFKIHFEKTYPGYLTRLRSSYPELSEAEERLFLFIKLNLTRKEAAAILGISADSVKKTRQRVRKRLDLDHEISLDDYIRNF